MRNWARSNTPDPPADNAEYINRYRDFKYNEVLFEQLAKQYELAKIDESREGAVIQVVDVAVPPERKANTPKAIVAIVAALAAGFVLLLFVFVRRALKNARQDPESASKLDCHSRRLWTGAEALAPTCQRRHPAN